MNIERIQAYSNSVYSQKSGDKIDAETKGGLTAEALDFEGQKRQQKESARDGQKDELEKEAGKDLASLQYSQKTPLDRTALHEHLEKHLDVIA